MLKQQLQQDLKTALKEQKKLEVSVLRMVLADLLNKEKEKRYKLVKQESDLSGLELDKQSQLTDEEVVKVFFSENKKRKDAITEFSAYGGSAKGGTKEKIEKVITKERAEMEILKKYLPEQLSENKIIDSAKQVIQETGAKELKDIGMVMKELMPKFQGRADGNLVIKIVKNLLNNDSNK